VRPVDQIEDSVTLKQVAVLLQKENQRLHDRLQVLLRENASLRGDTSPEQLQLEIAKLQEQMARFQKKLFAESSEKRPREPGEDSSSNKDPQRGHGPREQKLLPVVEELHELPPNDRQCPACQGELGEMKGQFEESEEITVVQRTFKIVKHRRQKYRCRCNGAVVTAPSPKRLVPGGRYSTEFAVEVAVNKYGDHLPLDRQRRIMEREGLVVDTQTLWDQVSVLAQAVKPTYEALRDQILASPHIHADETWWRLMDGPSSKRWYVWAVATDKAVYYRIYPTRSAKAAGDLLTGYTGNVMVDGYSAYGSLQRAGPGKKFVLSHCWSHVRRKFVEIEEFYPEECKQILDLIGKLYDLESQAPSLDRLEDDMRREALKLRADLRDKQSRPLISQIRNWAYGQRGTRESGLRKAIEYMLLMWSGLILFLDDPRIPLDNNRIERALRGVVLGRKNHYGSRSLRGTEVAAIFYSLLETAKLWKMDPKAYLLAVTKAAIEKPGSVLLPEDYIKQAKASVSAAA
jgi:transposase